MIWKANKCLILFTYIGLLNKRFLFLMFSKIMQKVYFIPGLGADKRVFNFLDLSFCEPIFIDWIKPSVAETLTSYAQRLFETIQDEKACIVGVSFGGMLATEIAKVHPDTKVIIISSAKTFLEIPGYLRFWRRLPLYKLHSDKNKNTLGKFILKILGSRGEDQKKLQLKILENSDPAFTRWATMPYFVAEPYYTEKYSTHTWHSR